MNNMGDAKRAAPQLKEEQKLPHRPGLLQSVGASAKNISQS